MKSYLFSMVSVFRVFGWLFVLSPTVAQAQNLLANSDFSQDNSGFVSDYTYAPGTCPSSNPSACPGWPEGTYTVQNDPNAWHPYFDTNFSDHSPSADNMAMFVNGSVNTNWVVWRQTVSNLTPNTIYDLSIWAVSIHPANTARLILRVNGAIVAGDLVLSSEFGQWAELAGVWNSGSASSATIEVWSINSLAGGNDFALDDASFSARPIPPEVSIVYPANGATLSSNQLSIRGTVDPVPPQSTLSVNFDHPEISCATLDVESNGIWTCIPIGNFIDGENYAVTAEVSSATGTSSSSVSFTINDGPFIEILNPNPSSKINETDVEVSGRAEIDSILDVYIDGTELCVDLAITDADEGKWSCPSLQSLGDGLHTIRVVATDSFGFSNETFAAFTVDTQTYVTILSPSDGSTVGSLLPVITGSSEPGAALTLSFSDSSVGCETLHVDPNGDWFCTLGTELNEGQNYVITARAIEDIGPNPAIFAQDQVTFSVNTFVFVSIDSPKNGTVTNQPQFTVNGTAEQGASLLVTLNSNLEICSIASVAASGNWSCPLPEALADGNYLIEAHATDNGQKATATSLVVVDTKFSLTIDEPYDGDTTYLRTPVIRGRSATDVDPSSMVLTLNHGASCTLSIQSNGDWQCIPTTPLLDETVYSISVSASDHAGNTASIQSEFTVRTHAFLTIDAPALGAVIDDPSPSIRGRADAGYMLSLSFVGGSLICETEVAADGNWSCPVTSALSDGDYVIRATSTDPSNANNVARRTSWFTVFTLDPSVEITSPSGTIDTLEPEVGGSSNTPDGTLVTVSLDGQRVCQTVVTDSAWNCGWNGAIVLEFGKDYTIEAVLQVGTKSASDSKSFTTPASEPQAGNVLDDLGGAAGGGCACTVATADDSPLGAAALYFAAMVIGLILNRKRARR
ncbi:MAG: hypothetical protein IPJ88_03190 [Myxococcales bacterium]|nr:MAG: hypothetical protein IPJ88_03190 [Myxococcales bacterium]